MTAVFDKMQLASASQPSRAGVLYRSTKLYDHNEGLSCCFRQWRADHSHCQQVHGYALAFRFVFATDRLDENNWCLDFGGLKEIRSWLHEMFDHTVLVAADDPMIGEFERMAEIGLMNLRILPAVGCEETARYELADAALARETLDIFAGGDPPEPDWMRPRLAILRDAVQPLAAMTRA